MKIHPTAIVSPSATLADDVEVGPYSIIGENVTIGPSCIVQAHAVIEKNVTIGEGNFFGYGCVIGAAPQDFAHAPEIHSEVRIGHRNRFREYVTIHRGTKQGTATTIGNDCFLMVGTHIGHNVSLADHVIITNNCLLAGYVDVGEGAVLGGGSVFHQFIRIGRRSMVAGGSRFNKDIPPFVTGNSRNIIVGINSVGLRRAAFPTEVRMEIKRAFKLIFRSGLNVREGLATAKKSDWSPEAQEFFAFIAASKRGTCTANRISSAPGASDDE